MWTIRFRFTRADYVALSVALARQSWSRRLVSVAVFFGCMIASATAVLLFRLPEGRHPLEIIPFIWWPFWLIPICGSVFIVYAHWIVTVPLALMIHRHNAVADEEITVTISETGIASEAEKFRGEINWPAIQRIIETPKHLFMTISKREAVTLPRRAFEAKEDYQAMRDFARAHVPEGTRYETV